MQIYLDAYIEAPKTGEWGNEDYTGKGIPVIRTANFTDNGVINYSNIVTRDISQKKFEEKALLTGDIIIEKSGGSDTKPVGRVVYYDGESHKYLFNNFTSVLRVKNKEELNSRYLFYFLFHYYRTGNTKRFENKTTGLHNLKLDAMLKQTLFAPPSLCKQNRCVESLDKVNVVVRHLQQEIDLLDSLTKSRFVEMFGDPQMNPFQWPIKRVGELATEIKYGTSLPSVDGGKYPYLRMNNLTNDGHLDLSDLKYIDIPNSELEKCLVRKGDVLFNRTNSIELIGKTATYNLNQEMVIAGYIIRVRLNEEMNPDFFSTLFNLEFMKVMLQRIAKGAVNQANINSKELQSIRIYVPPIEKQNCFVEFMHQIDKSKAVIQKSLDEAQLLFDSLMQEYFG